MKRAWIAFALVTALGCGDDDGVAFDSGPSPDAGDAETPDVSTPDAPAPDAGEMVCGNGTVEGSELCDTDIAAGEDGACPTECAPVGVGVCIANMLVGTECMAECAETPITEPANDDGCCPEGASSNNDNDCLTENCGNGVVDDDEVCDVAIEAGEDGACPTDCDDGASCTFDALIRGGTCGAVCTNTPIMETADDDGCCPDGATFDDDNDCSESCGNGVVDADETCDTDIAPGEAGACPTSCDDEMDCTADVLMSARTCSAECVSTPITLPADGDMCCPSGATASSDDDCPSVCRNGVREPGEECDDGNDVDDDLCANDCTNNAAITAFRLDSIAIVDPEIYADLAGASCLPAKSLVNPQLQGTVDDFTLNAVVAFQPLDPMMVSTPVDVYIQASCDSGGCTSGPQVESSTAFNQESGNCYAPPAGSRHLPYGALNVPTADCFSADTRTVTFNLAGSPITLTNVTVAGTYETGRLTNGVLAGFITFESARATTVTLPGSLGTRSVFELLQSGMAGDACDTASSPMNDADDLDGDGTDDGWWFFLDVTASEVTFTP